MKNIKEWKKWCADNNIKWQEPPEHGDIIVRLVAENVWVAITVLKGQWEGEIVTNTGKTQDDALYKMEKRFETA